MKRYGLSLIETVVSTVLLSLFLSYISLLSVRIRQTHIKQTTHWNESLLVHNDTSFQFYYITDYIPTSSAIQLSHTPSPSIPNFINLTYSLSFSSIKYLIFRPPIL